jgi:peptidoglycan/LPS O-acetylase OafA/YrhL
LLRRCSELAYPFYIWHQTVIVVLAYFVCQLQLGIAAKYSCLLAGSFVATVVLSLAVSKTTITRWMFGLSSPRLATGQLPATRPAV